MNELRDSLHNISAGQLRNFLAVAETGSFTAASELLGVAQPTISKSMASLERKIGRLFERRRGSVVKVNAAGIILHEMAPQMIQNMIGLRRRLDAARGNQIELKCGAGVYLFEPISQLIEEYQEINRQIKIGIQKTLSRNDTLQMLDLGMFDIAFITQFDKPAEHSDELYAHSDLKLVEKPAQQSASASPFPTIRLAPVTWLGKSKEALHDQSDGPFIFAPNYSSAIELCLQGKGRTYMFASDAEKFLRTGELREIPSKRRHCYRTCRMHGNDPLLATFGQFVINKLRDL